MHIGRRWQSDQDYLIKGHGGQKDEHPEGFRRHRPLENDDILLI